MIQLYADEGQSSATNLLAIGLWAIAVLIALPSLRTVWYVVRARRPQARQQRAHMIRESADDIATRPSLGVLVGHWDALLRNPPSAGADLSTWRLLMNLCDGDTRASEPLRESSRVSIAALNDFAQFV